MHTTRRTNRFVAFILSVLAAASPTFAQWYTLDLDSQFPDAPHIIPRTFEGNTPYIRTRIFNNKSPVNASPYWTMTFWYSTDRDTATGVQIPGSWSSSNTCDFLGPTNVFFGQGKYYFSVRGIHNSGYTKTWGAGTMYQEYDPAADTNLQSLLSSVSIEWYTNGVFATVESNRLNIIVLQTGKVDVVTWAASNAVYEARIAGIESQTDTWNSVTGKLAITTFDSWSNTHDVAFTAYTNAQASTNAQFETRIVAVETGKVTLIDYQSFTNAQTWTNSGFETRISELEGSTSTWNAVTGKLDTSTFNSYTNTQANTNATLQSQITSLASQSSTWATVTGKLATTVFDSYTNAHAMQTGTVSSVSGGLYTTNTGTILDPVIDLTPAAILLLTQAVETATDASTWSLYPATNTVNVQTNPVLYVNITSNGINPVTNYSEVVTTNAGTPGVNIATNTGSATGYAALSGYAVSNAFDGNASQTEFYRTTGGSSGDWWMKYDCGASTGISAYAIHDYTSSANFCMDDWNFYGSDDDTNWTLILSETNASTYIQGGIYTNTFATPATNRYFMWTNIYDTGGGRIHVPLMELRTGGTPTTYTTNYVPVSTNYTYTYTTNIEYHLRGPGGPYDAGSLTNLNEEDPIWSAVSNTVTTGATAGTTAYGWGNHATNGYLTDGATLTNGLYNSNTNEPTSDQLITLAQLEGQLSLYTEQVLYGSTNAAGAPYEAAVLMFSETPVNAWTQTYSVAVGTTLVGVRIYTNQITQLSHGAYIHHVNISYSQTGGAVLQYRSDLALIGTDGSSTNVVATGGTEGLTTTAIQEYMSSSSLTSNYLVASTQRLAVLRYVTRTGGASASVSIFGGNNHATSPTVRNTRLETPSLQTSVGVTTVANTTDAAGVASVSGAVLSIGTNTSGIVTNAVPPTSAGNASGSLTIDFTLAGVQSITQTGAVTNVSFTVASTNHESAVLVEWYGNGSSVTWPTSILSFATNAAPTLTSNEWNRLHFSGYRGRYFMGKAGSAP
jgi:hypothetical protein